MRSMRSMRRGSAAVGRRLETRSRGRGEARMWRRISSLTGCRLSAFTGGGIYEA
jgi:hypothetical protein